MCILIDFYETYNRKTTKKSDKSAKYIYKQ